MKYINLILLLVAGIGCNQSWPEEDIRLNEGLVAHYSFNGDANDQTTYTNHATIYGAVLTEDYHGNANSAYYFDGVDDYIEITHQSQLLPDSGLTVSVWFKASSFLPDGDWMSIVDKYEDTNVGYGIYLEDKNTIPNFDEIVAHSYMQYTGGFGTSSGQKILGLNQFYHVCMTVSNEETRRIYFNGEMMEESEGSNFEYLQYGEDNILIGNSVHGNNYPFNGVIDEIRIYNRDLAPVEVFALIRNYVEE